VLCLSNLIRADREDLNVGAARCRLFRPGQIRVFAERWRARPPLPFTRAARAERRFRSA